MMKNRQCVLLFLSVCVLSSPGVYGDDRPAAVDALLKAAPVALVPGNAIAASAASLASPEDSGDELSTADTAFNALSDDEPKPSEGEASASEIDAIAQQRRLFLQAEVAIANNDDARYFLLADQLESYPLYSYLQYQWLSKHLQHDRQIEYFLEHYAASRYAPALKQRWLYRLAREGRWQMFLQYYSGSRDASMNCYYHRAQFNTGQQQAAMLGARDLWLVGHSQPAACDPLFSEFEKSSLFEPRLVWQRFDAALGNNKTRLARYLQKRLPEADQKTAELWLSLHHNPGRYLPELLARPWSVQSKYMFSHAIDRLAGADIQQAIALWDKHKKHYNLTADELTRIEKRLAFKLAYENNAAAYERLGQLDDSDRSSKTMRIRVALYEQNWSRVITAIEDLSAADQKLEKWQYWLARAYRETGKPLQAEEILSELANQRDFYGYLAAESLQRQYQLGDRPTQVSEQDISRVENHTAFRAVFELMVLERDTQARLQWWHALRQLRKTEYPAAAKLAQKWRWDDVAIFTIAKVKQWDDIAMRFPLTYTDKIHENAELQNLNPVILFGLIRRESAFNKDARSPSGAQGLMQIMPQTGRQIAIDLDESRPDRNDLYDPVKNLQYGAYYYQKLLNQFDGHYAVALAAYNAGPNRVKKWLPEAAMPADIWIETIPFRETRDYVTSVLVYAMIYQQRMRMNELSMSDFTRVIAAPKSEAISLNEDVSTLLTP